MSEIDVTKRRILAVDDQEMNLRLLERILRRAGYEEILGTSQPEGVMELLDTWQPDIVLLDLHMPGLNGFEVLQQIRERTVTPAAYMPVLVLTADILPETKLRALEQGASAFLVTGTGPHVLQPIDEIHLTPGELNMATIETDLTQNPDRPVYAILMNRDFSESAVVLDDRRAVIAKLLEVMEIDATEIGNPSDFADLVQESYAARGWKGLLIASVNPQTLDYDLIGPEELGFSMEDLQAGGSDLPEP